MRTLLLFCMLKLLAFGAGPEKIATFDRALWSKPIDSRKAFDLASRHEIISYVRQINLHDTTDVASIKNFTSVKNISVNSVNKWLTFTKKNLYSNFIHAQKSCQTNEPLCTPVTNWTDLENLAKLYTPDLSLVSWFEASQTFFSYYLYEQIRLAALFPNITSEIDTLDPSESQGFEYQDGTFLLTFDDGPKYLQTAKLIDLLHTLKINGLFFVLGENLEQALKIQGQAKIQTLYTGMCVGSHGYIHKVHPKLQNWKPLYAKTKQLIADNQLLNEKQKSLWFRPPYGQRDQSLIDHLATLDDKVMLWNIDSQDWNRKLSVKQVEDRLVTLMLLHRKGIILFHDVHTKAAQSIKALNELLTKSQMQWVDCKTIPTSNKVNELAKTTI